MASGMDRLLLAGIHTTVQQSVQSLEPPPTHSAEESSVSHDDVFRELQRTALRAADLYDAAKARIKHLEACLQTVQKAAENAIHEPDDDGKDLEAVVIPYSQSGKVNQSIPAYKTKLTTNQSLYPKPMTSAVNLASEDPVTSSLVLPKQACGKHEPLEPPRPLTEEEMAAIQKATTHTNIHIYAITTQQYHTLQEVHDQQGSEAKQLCALTGKERKFLQKSKKRALGQDMNVFRQLAEDEWETVQLARRRKYNP